MFTTRIKHGIVGGLVGGDKCLVFKAGRSPDADEDPANLRAV